jgi:hypothetical protein
MFASREPGSGSLPTQLAERHRKHAPVVVGRGSIERCGEGCFDRRGPLELADAPRGFAPSLGIVVGQRLDEPSERDAFRITSFAREPSGKMSESAARRSFRRPRTGDALLRDAGCVLSFDAEDGTLGLLHDDVVFVGEEVEQLADAANGRREAGIGEPARKVSR